MADAVYARLTGESGYFDSKVAFIAASGPKDARRKQLAIMDYDGANAVMLTDGARAGADAAAVARRRGRCSTRATSAGAPKVMLMQAGGGSRTVIDDTSGMTFAPRFSPDGRRAVFSMSVGTGSDLFVTDLGGRGHTQLTRSSSIDTAPAFSPDGNSIVFESDRGGTQQLYVMPASGGEARRVSFGDGRYATPVWSPRGDMIAFTKIDGGRFHIGVMRTDGSGEKLLTGSYLDEGPTWAPNGRVLMFFRESPGVERRAAALFGGHHRAEPETGADGGLRLRPVVVGAARAEERKGTERMRKITTLALLALALAAAGCARETATSPVPDAGYSGAGGGSSGTGAARRVWRRTLPGSTSATGCSSRSTRRRSSPRRPGCSTPRSAG